MPNAPSTGGKAAARGKRLMLVSPLHLPHTARPVTATTSRRVFTTASQRCVSGQRPVHADAATFPHCFIRHTPSALYSRMAAAITATIITMAPTMNQFLPILRVLAA